MSDGISDGQSCVPEELVESVLEFLGDDGIDFFLECLENHGTVTPVIGGTPPHPVHLREGMQVRNHMRSHPACKDWTDHDFDTMWTSVIHEVLCLKAGRLIKELQ